MRKFKSSSIKKLSKKQLAVIDDLFDGRSKEADVLKKHKVSKGIYRKWLKEENFVGELAFRVEASRRQSDLIIAKFAPKAALKLVELADSEKNDTSRKACLDIISLSLETNTPKEKSKNVREHISSESAEKLLAEIAGREQ